MRLVYHPAGHDDDLGPDQDALGIGVDALHALAVRLRGQDPGAWPRLLLLIGVAVALALYLSNSKSANISPAVYVLIGIVVGGALLRIARTRRR